MIAQSNIRMPGERAGWLAGFADSRRKWWLFSSSAEDSVAALLKEAETGIRRVLVSEYLVTQEEIEFPRLRARLQK